MKKVVRDGKVAILISVNYGAGWSTSNKDYPELLFHPTLVEMVKAGKQSEIDQEFCIKVLGLPEETYIYCGGAKDLVVEWLEEGTSFTVEEYDGFESLRTFESLNYTA